MVCVSNDSIFNSSTFLNPPGLCGKAPPPFFLFLQSFLKLIKGKRSEEEKLAEWT